MLGILELVGCGLLELTDPPSENQLDDLRVVWVQTDPPAATPGSLFFIDAAIANPQQDPLRVFAFACLPDTDNCGAVLGSPVLELVAVCEDGSEPPCLDVRASTGFELDPALIGIFPIDGSQVEVPLFVAACVSGQCPSALTDPVDDPVTALGLDGSTVPPPDVVRDGFAVAVRGVVAKPVLETGDDNPDLHPLDDALTFDPPLLSAGETIDLEFLLEGPARNVANVISGFTTGGRLVIGDGDFERSGVRRGKRFTYRFTMPSPARSTATWIVVDENGSSAGAFWSTTFRSR